MTAFWAGLGWFAFQLLSSPSLVNILGMVQYTVDVVEIGECLKTALDMFRQLSHSPLLSYPILSEVLLLENFSSFGPWNALEGFFI